jgi:hypothetical protein
VERHRHEMFAGGRDRDEPELPSDGALQIGKGLPTLGDRSDMIRAA